MPPWLGSKLPREFASSLACPACRALLVPAAAWFSCRACKRKYPVEDGIPVLWERSSRFKIAEADFYGNEAGRPGIASLLRRYYKDTAYDQKIMTLPERYLRPNALILSLGGGDGRHGLRFLMGGYRVMETDLSPGMMRAAAKKLETQAGDWAVAAVDAEALPFAQDTFDAIYMYNVLQLIQDKRAIAGGITRCLKRGGYVVLASEPNDWFYKIFRPLAQVLRIRAGQLDGQSLAGEADRGVSYRDISELAASASLDIACLKPKYFLTGLLYNIAEGAYRLAPEDLRERVYLPRWAVELTTRLDGVIEHLPVIRRFPFFWVAVLRKK